jgi:chromosome segregation ATPase
MVIQELDAEIEAHEGCREQIRRMRTLEETRENLEDELRFYQGRWKELGRASSGDEDAGEERVRVKRAIERIRGELRAVHEEHSRLRDHIDKSFHPYWGSLLKQDNDVSSFGQQVETYADVYMRRVSCLRHYSPMQFFRSPHDLMPHEL